MADAPRCLQPVHDRHLNVHQHEVHATQFPLRDRLLALWDEYERGETAEALAVKALDKLETLLQHTQGDNPADFDYAFNLDYGRRYTDRAPLFKTLRELLDARTRQRLAVRRDA